MPKPKPLPLRERVRLLSRDAVLDVASELFLARGYRATTVQAIADGSGVGVATVFRYFRSKEGVLAALSRRDIDHTLARARHVAATPATDPSQSLLAVFDEILEMHRLPSTRIRGQTRIWLLIPTGHPDTDEVVKSSDAELQALIRSLLAHYRAAGRLRAGLDLNEATIVIFAVFYHHYLALALDEQMSARAVRAALASRIPMLFAPWLSAYLTVPQPRDAVGGHRRSADARDTASKRKPNPRQRAAKVAPRLPSQMPK